MELFHSLLTRQTWFSQKLKPKKEIAAGGTMTDGMYHRFGINAFTFELNANYIEKLDRIPETTDWKDLGANLNEVIYQYLNQYQRQ